MRAEIQMRAKMITVKNLEQRETQTRLYAVTNYGVNRVELRLAMIHYPTF